MFKSKVARASLRRINTIGDRVFWPKQHWLDVWLPRLSHIAQFGLFTFTLVFSYFTVLPLYQKSVLEEAVAKRELELAALNKSLETSYLKLRDYAMRQFFLEAMPACGGLFIERTYKGEESAKPPRAEMVFRLDIPPCLKNLANKVEALKDLKSSDRKTFDRELERVSNTIALGKQQSIKEYEAAPSKVTDDDWYTLPSDSLRVQVQKEIEGWRGGVPDLKARRRIAEQIAKERVGLDYEDLIRDQVLSLRRIKWETP